MENILTNKTTPFDASGGLQLAGRDILSDYLENNPVLGSLQTTSAMSSYGFEELLNLSTQGANAFGAGFNGNDFFNQYAGVFDNGFFESHFEFSSETTANALIDEMNGDSLIGINGNQPLAGALNFGASINSNSTVETLDSTDPDNPNRFGSFRDDYLLRGVSVGQQVQVNLNSSEFDTYLQLVNADTGQVIAFNDDGGPGFNSQLTFNVEANVDYILRTTSYGSGATGEYTLTTSAGSAIPATPIMGNQTVTGILDNSDPNNPTRSGSFSDDYLLRGVTAGQQVQVNLNAGFDTYLQLVNADTGQVIDFNDDGGPGLNSQLSFTAQNGIDYILRVTSYGSGATGEYTLTTNAPLQGTLDSTDPNNPTRSGRFSDDYLLRGVSVGQQVQVNLNSSEFDTYLQLVNADTGQVIAFNDDGGPGFNSQLTFNVEANVDYILRTTSYGSGATGEYTLTTSAGSAIPATPIMGNQTVTGILDNSDPNNPTRSGRFSDDYLLRRVTAGQQVQVNLNAGFDTYLQLVNADTGQVIDFNDDGGPGLNSQLSFTAQNGIDYILRVTSYGSEVTGEYTLTTNTEGSTPVNPFFNATYGYGLVNAAAAVAQSIAQTTFADVPNLGGNQWGNDLVNAPEVWAQGFTGQGVTVAVIDSGVDINHEDLRDNIWTNPGEIAGNGIDDDGNGFIDDVNGWNFGNGGNNNVLPGTNNPGQGHGTHVAGTIAAMNNNLGATGVAHDAQIMAIRMGDVSGRSFTNVGSLANAIRYAVDNGADVINMSLGWSDSTALRDALAYAAANNVITVTAAGNDGLPSPGNPARYATQFGISVGAVDRNSNIAGFSNRAGSDSNMQHVVAPGVDVFSTLPNDGYGINQGTSMAAPHVAGVVALMLSANPNLTHAQVRQILTDSAIALA